MKYAFIKGHWASFPLRTLCLILRVSRSGYYAWLRRHPRRNKRFELLTAIRDVHKTSRRSYGSPRIFKALRNAEVSVGKSTVERVMREHNIRGKKRRGFKRTTDSRHDMPIAENIVNRQFDRGAKNRVWLSDITYLRLKNGLLLHSDRGSQYASDDYRNLIKSFQMVQSMSRRGNCWDNAPMERFFDTLKTELIDNQIFEDVHEAKTIIFEWIEVFYNRKRLHSALGYLSPACFEEKYLAMAA